jgi:type I restriction enzyme S subunit
LLSGGTPKTDVVEYWKGNIKWLSAKDVTKNHSGFILETEKKITELGIKKSAAKLLPQYTTIVSARGTVGNYCILSEPMAISQSNFGIITKNKDRCFYGFLLISSLIEKLKRSAYGSVFDTVTARNFQELKIIIPSQDMCKTFDILVNKIYLKSLLNYRQIQTLTKIRDSLLPKLMSGQIRVEE